MLELRPICENCATSLPPDSIEARICSFECTKHRPVDREAHERFAEKLKGISPVKR